MPETLAFAPADVNQSVESHNVAGSREAVLKQLLPWDYDYAVESGLIDMFQYNPDTHEDGLLHTLVGDVQTGPDGSILPQGFHHEPSAELVSPRVMVEGSAEALPATRVYQPDLDALPAKKRRAFDIHPFEPHNAQVVIDGHRKHSVHTDPTTGEKTIAVSKNSMYPKEYDALAVMQAIRIARDTRNPEQDKLSTTNDGEQVIVSDSSAPLIDGRTPMPIRLVLDARTGKVITAIPIMGNNPGLMKLTEAEAWHHVVNTWKELPPTVR